MVKRLLAKSSVSLLCVFGLLPVARFASAHSDALVSIFTIGGLATLFLLIF